MNLRNKLCLLFILSVVLFGSFYACSEDSTEIPAEDFAQLRDVSLMQTVDGKESTEMKEKNAVITFTSQLTFNNKTIRWPNPTLVQSFDKLFDITKETISVTNAQGVPVTTVNVTVDETNKIKIVFTKANNDYNYMKSSAFKISVKTKLKTNITDEEIADFIKKGYQGESIFYGQSDGESIKSNRVAVTLSILDTPELQYNVKGDPNNSDYLKKLNIIYFIASDMQANPDYQKRISTILLNHQLFVCKWMKHWGYEEKSFGLPMDKNGMVELVTVHAKGPKTDYPYSGGASKVKAEIEQYYKDNGKAWQSDHTIVITATDSNIGSVPFYGMGKWCYALDYPGMAFESLAMNPVTGEMMNPKTDESQKAMKWIGGMLHELGHGLNKPHIGPTYSHKNDPDFGMTLMGSGNYSYGSTPTYLHASSAAIMNNCQISSKTSKGFYTSTTASVNITKVSVNGNKCFVEGTFEASQTVTDIIVRFYKSTENHLGGADGYTSVGFVVKPSGKNFEALISIDELRVNTFDYKIGATIFMDNGTTKNTTGLYTYRLVNTGSNYTLKNDVVENNGNWEVTTSHPLPQDDQSISNAPRSLVDENLSTILSMVKPGKSYGGIKVEKDESVYAIINFSQQLEYNAIQLINRNFRKFLNAKTVSFYGSNDGVSFDVIKSKIALPNDKENIIAFDTTVKYQYLKVTFDEWDATEGNTMQVAELIVLHRN